MPKKDIFGEVVRLLSGVHPTRLGLVRTLIERISNKNDGAKVFRGVAKYLEKKRALSWIGKANLVLGSEQKTEDCFADQEIFGTDRDSRIETFLPKVSKVRDGAVSGWTCRRNLTLLGAAQEFLELVDGDQELIEEELVSRKYLFSPGEVDQFVLSENKRRACKPNMRQHNYFPVLGAEGRVYVLCVRWVLGVCRVLFCFLDSKLEVPEGSLVFFRHLKK